MDIKLEKKPWYIRYRYYLMGGLLFAAFLGYVVILSLGPRKLRIDAENVQIAEVKEDNFMEYVDVARKEVCFSREIPFLSFPIRICFAALKTSVTNGRSK